MAKTGCAQSELLVVSTNNDDVVESCPVTNPECKCRYLKRLCLVTILICVITWIAMGLAVGYFANAVSIVSHRQPQEIPSSDKRYQDLAELQDLAKTLVDEYVSKVFKEEELDADEEDYYYDDDLEHDRVDLYDSSTEEHAEVGLDIEALPDETRRLYLPQDEYDYRDKVVHDDEYDDGDVDVYGDEDFNEEGSGIEHQRSVRSADDMESPSTSTDKPRRRHHERRRKNRGEKGKGKKIKKNRGRKNKGVFAAHYPGQFSLDQMDSLVGQLDQYDDYVVCKEVEKMNGTLCRNGTLRLDKDFTRLNIFTESDLTTESPFTLHENGRFVVKEKGLILMYAQVFFKSKDLNGIKLLHMRRGREIRELTSKQNGAVPLNLLGLFTANVGDWFQLVSTEKHATVRLAHGLSFLGAVQWRSPTYSIPPIPLPVSEPKARKHRH